jgi:hypothetical protein
MARNTNTARVNTGAAIKSFGEAKGKATAEMFFKVAGEQANRLREFLVTIACHMDQPARQAFRLTIEGELKKVRDDIKAKKAAIDDAIKTGAPDEQVATMRRELGLIEKTFKSQQVRSSEAKRFAEAIDKNYAVTEAQIRAVDYHRAVCEARQHLTDTTGPRRGRTVKSVDVRVAEFMKRMVDKGEATKAQLGDAMTKVRTAMKGWEEPAAKPAEEAKPVEPRNIGPTQRQERKTKGKGDGFVPEVKPTHPVPAQQH